MNCHGENNHGRNGNKSKGHGKHMLLMVLCCAIPLVLLLLLPALRIESKLIKSILPFSMLIICPLMHGLMMIPMLIKKDKNSDNQQEVYTREIEE